VPLARYRRAPQTIFSTCGPELIRSSVVLPVSRVALLVIRADTLDRFRSQRAAFVMAGIGRCSTIGTIPGFIVLEAGGVSGSAPPEGPSCLNGLVQDLGQRLSFVGRKRGNRRCFSFLSSPGDENV